MKEYKLMTIKEIRALTELSQAKFCKMYGIPKRTLENWESGKSPAPSYTIALLERAVKEDYCTEKDKI